MKAFFLCTDRLYAVNGGDDATKALAIFGSTWNPANESLVNTWQPKNMVGDVV